MRKQQKAMMQVTSTNLKISPKKRRQHSKKKLQSSFYRNRGGVQDYSPFRGTGQSDDDTFYLNNKSERKNSFAPNQTIGGRQSMTSD
jgi:hypothetical protein